MPSPMNGTTKIVDLETWSSLKLGKNDAQNSRVLSGRDLTR